MKDYEINVSRADCDHSWHVDINATNREDHEDMLINGYTVDGDREEAEFMGRIWADAYEYAKTAGSK